MEGVDPIGVVAAVLRAGVGVVFVAAAMAKFAMGGDRLARLIDSYEVLPPRLVRGLALVLPAAELTVGSLLVLGAWTRPAAALAIALLSVFSAAMAVAIRRGRTDGCGCFGRALAQRLRWRLVARNTALAAVAAGVLIADGGFASLGTFLAQSQLGGGIR